MKKHLLLVILILVCSVVLFPAEKHVEFRLRVYEGARQGTLTPPKFVTSSYIQPNFTVNIQTTSDLAEEMTQIKRVYNLQDIILLTEADLSIGIERTSIHSDSNRHYIRLNGNTLMFFLQRKEDKSDSRYVVIFNEITEDKPKKIFEASILLQNVHSSIFGFEDRQGKPYFCSLRITGPVPPPPSPPPPPLPLPPSYPKLEKELHELEKGAVKALSTINPPLLIEKVDPIYPEAARKDGLKGSVYMAVRTDEKGHVKRVLIIRSSNSIFNDAAVKAVMQWKYEPYYQDGKPVELVFSVSVRF